MGAKKYIGADGEVRFIPERGVFIGFFGGKVVATRNNKSAVENYLEKLKSDISPIANNTSDEFALKRKIAARVKQIWGQAQTMYPKLSSDAPSVGWFHKGSHAGKALRYKNVVEFNAVLAAENSHTFDDTVIHEVAHRVVFNVFPFAKPHGPEFKKVMRALGGSGNTFHHFDTSSVKTSRKNHKYTCSCGLSHMVGTRRHNCIQSKSAIYFCKKCNSDLTYVGKV